MVLDMVIHIGRSDPKRVETLHTSLHCLQPLHSAPLKVYFMKGIPPPAKAKRIKTLIVRYQSHNQKSQATTQTLEMYADANTLPYRELFALAQHTGLFTNGLGNW